MRHERRVIAVTAADLLHCRAEKKCAVGRFHCRHWAKCDFALSGAPLVLDGRERQAQLFEIGLQQAKNRINLVAAVFR